MKGIDGYNNLTDHAEQLKAKGIELAARYLFNHSAFKEHLTKAEVEALGAQGIGIVTVWENGEPTSDDYFTEDRAASDAHLAIQKAQEVGQPAGSPIYFAADCDANPNTVATYFKTLSPLVRLAGYEVGVYGSGDVCKKLAQDGLVSHTWLAQSTGWAGYEDWKPHADIVQGPAEKLLGDDVDSDTFEHATNAGIWGPGYQSVKQHDGSVTTVATPVEEDVAQPVTDLPTLKLGDNGPAVTALQRALNVWSGEVLSSHIPVDGDFGPMTKGSVLRFQNHHELAADGIVGQQTWTALEKSVGASWFASVTEGIQ